jgi:CHAT domain-containing protein/tetratricopeptide (TPR) repeat protein
MKARIFNECFPSYLVASLASSILIFSAAVAPAQAPPEKDVAWKSKLPWQRVLQGDDAKRVAALEKQIADLEKKGQFAEAVAPARAVQTIRSSVQGEDHWQTVNARTKEQTCARVASLAREAQSDLATAIRHSEEVERLHQEGRYAEAEPLSRGVLAIRRKLLGEDHSDTARSYIQLTENLDAQGRYEEAKPLCQKALEIDRSALGENHPYTAESYNDVAANLDGQGQYAEAEPHYRRALAINLHTQGEDAPRTADACDNLGISLRDQGKYAEALPLLHKALEIRRRVLGEINSETARSYNNLAYDLSAQGKDAEAEPLLRRALEIHRLTSGEDHPDTALAHNNLGANLRDQGKYTEAQPLLQKALDVWRRRLGVDHLHTAAGYSNLAANLEKQEKYAEAQSLHRKALDIWRSRLGENHPYLAVGYSSLAADLHGQGKYVEAEALYDKALEIRRKRLGEDHDQTARSYTNLALNLTAQGKYTDAEARAGAAARSYEAARLRISFTGMGRIALGSRQSPVAVSAALLARRGRDADAWQRWESGLARGLFDDLAARRRPLTLDERRGHDELAARLDRLDNQIGARTRSQSPTNDQRKQLEELKSQRLELQGRLVQLEAELIQKYKATAGAMYTLAQIQAQLLADAALVGWLDIKTTPNTADPRGDHWACVVRRSGAPQWIRIVGTGRDQAWIKDDDERPGQVRQLLSSEIEKDWRKPLATLAQQRLAPLEPALEDRDGLPAVRHLIVLPSPALAGIPVEAMIETRPPAAPRRLVSYAPSGTIFTWLQERRRAEKGNPAQPRRLLALADPVPPSADTSNPPAPKPPDHGLLVQQVEPGSNAEQAGIRPGDVLLQYAGAKLGNLDDLQKQVQAGDPKAKTVAVAVWRDGKTLDLTLRPGPIGVVPNSQPAAQALIAQREGDIVLRRSRGAAFDPLPGSRREVQAITSLFERNEVHLGSDASEQTLDSLRSRGELGTFTVIHLATHGKIDDLSPMNSWLLLSQDKLPDPTAALSLDGPAYDGALSAGEVMSTWKLNAELVALSACSSGLGRLSGGEGFVGFAQSFFLAGSRSVIVSLWEVDDRATSLLMTRFYRNWLGKRPGLEQPLSKAEALHEAKAWLRGLTGTEVERELSQISRGEIRSRSRPAPQSHPFAHPHDWAGFILMGDPS